MWLVHIHEVFEAMKLPEIQKCPGCGGDPLVFHEGLDLPGMRCNNCGFSASGRDVLRADFLVNTRAVPSIREAAEKIARRSALNYEIVRFR